MRRYPHGKTLRSNKNRLTSAATAIVAIVAIILLVNPLLLPTAANAEIFVLKWGTSGSGSGQFKTPTGIAVDSSGNVFVADSGNNRIQKFDPDGAAITKWGVSGNKDGQFKTPTGIAVDSSGNVFVADSGNNRIQKFTSSDGIAYKLAKKWGSNGVTDSKFKTPTGVAIDSAGNVYVVDNGNNRIQKFTNNGVFIKSWGVEGDGHGRFKLSNAQTGITVDLADRVLVVDTGNNRVQVFDTEGVFLTTFGSAGSADGQFKSPTGITTDLFGNIYVVDSGNQRVQKFDSTGAFLRKWGSLGTDDGQFAIPVGIDAIVSPSGPLYIYVGDVLRNRIQLFSFSPIVSSIDPTNPRWGLDTVTISGTIRDIPAANIGNYKVTVDVGDGTAPFPSLDIDAATFAWRPVTHIYNLPGTYDIVIKFVSASDPTHVVTFVTLPTTVLKHKTQLFLDVQVDVVAGTTFTPRGFLEDAEIAILPTSEPNPFAGLGNKPISFSGTAAEGSNALPGSVTDGVVFEDPMGLEVRTCADCIPDEDIILGIGGAGPNKVMHMHEGARIIIPPGNGIKTASVDIQNSGATSFTYQLVQSDGTIADGVSSGISPDAATVQLIAQAGTEVSEFRILSIGSGGDGTIGISMLRTFDQAGEPAEKFTINFEDIIVDASTGGAFLGTSAELKKGSFFSTGVTDSTPGELNLQAHFAGDELYEASSSLVRTFNKLPITLGGTAGEPSSFQPNSAQTYTTYSCSVDSDKMFSTLFRPDGICDAWEKYTSTDPKIRITENVGIPYTVTVSGTTVAKKYNLCYIPLGTTTPVCPDVNKPDVFIEHDFMQFHQLSATAASNVKTAFANKGVNIHLLADEQLVHVNNINVWVDPTGYVAPAGIDPNTDDFANIKRLHFGFKTSATDATKNIYGGPAEKDAAGNPIKAVLDAKAMVYRYFLGLHNCGGGTSSGLAETPGNDSMMCMGSFTIVNNHPVGTTVQQGGTAIHEWGHNLNLHHGGPLATLDANGVATAVSSTDYTMNYKPNYPSPENYARQFDTYLGRSYKYDFSNEAMPIDVTGNILDEANLVESKGVKSTATTTLVWAYDSAGKRVAKTGSTNTGLSWNGDTDTTDTGAFDINYFGTTGSPASAGQKLKGFNDWNNLKFNFRPTTGYFNGVYMDPDKAPEEITPEEVEEQRETTTTIWADSISTNEPKHTIQSVDIQGRVSNPPDGSSTATIICKAGDIHSGIPLSFDGTNYSWSASCTYSASDIANNPHTIIGEVHSGSGELVKDAIIEEINVRDHDVTVTINSIGNGGGGFTFGASGTAFDADTGDGLGSVPINFITNFPAGDGILGSTTTDSSGVYSQTGTAPSAIGIWHVQAEFPGAVGLAPSLSSIEIFETLGSEWVVQFGDDDSDDMAADISTGSIYVVGRGGSFLGEQTGVDNSDATLSKYDTQHNLIWTRQIGTSESRPLASTTVPLFENVITTVDGTSRSYSNSPAACPEGASCDFKIIGYVHSTQEPGTRALTFKGTSLGFVHTTQVPGTVAIYDHDFFFFSSRDHLSTSASCTFAGSCKVARLGYIHTSQTGSDSIPVDTEIRALVLGTSASGTTIFVAGTTEGALLGETWLGNRDAFVRAYDTNGNELWTQQFGTPGGDIANDVAVLTLRGSNVVAVVGQTDGTFPGRTSAGGFDAFVKAYTTEGTFIDDTDDDIDQFGTSANDEAIAVASGTGDVDGADLIVVGYLGATTANFDNAQAFARFYTGSKGGFQDEFGTAGIDIAYDVSASPSGVYVVGDTTGALEADGSNAGGFDAFIRKYDIFGNLQWTRQFGTVSNDSILGVAQDASGIFVAGETGGSLVPGQANAGGNDAFMRKYDSEGNVVSTRQFGTVRSDGAMGISTDATGIYVSGVTSGVFRSSFQPLSNSIPLYYHDSTGSDDCGEDPMCHRASTPAEGDFTDLIDNCSHCINNDNDLIGYILETELPDTIALKYSDYLSGRHFDGVEWDLTSTQVSGTTLGFIDTAQIPGTRTLYFHDLVPWGDGSPQEFDFTNTNADACRLAVGRCTSIPIGYIEGVHEDAFIARFLPPAPVATTLTLDPPGDVPAGAVMTFTGTLQAGSVGVAGKTINVNSGAPGSASAIAVTDVNGHFIVTMAAPTTIGTFTGHASFDGDSNFLASSGERTYNVVASGAEWIRQFGTAGHDTASAIAAGSVYVVGSVSGLLPGFETLPTGSLSGTDAYLRKYDINGAVIWTQQFGSGTDDVATAVAVDPSGAFVYVGGRGGGTFFDDPIGGDPERGAASYLRKYDSSNGNLVWSKRFNAGGNENVFSIAIDSSGAYVAGAADIGGDPDGFVKKFSASDGSEIWTHTYELTGLADAARGVAADGTGVYVAGETGTNTIVTDNTFPSPMALGSGQAFISKLDSGTGTQQWITTFGSGSGTAPRGISIDGSGAYAAGYTYGALAGQASAGTLDAFVKKVNKADGSVIWTQQSGSAAPDGALGISAYNERVHVVGGTDGEFVAGQDLGITDFFSLTYDDDGNLILAEQEGTDDFDLAFGVSANADGIFIVGETRGSFPGQTSAGMSDAFVVKRNHPSALPTTLTLSVTCSPDCFSGPTPSTVTASGQLTGNGAGLAGRTITFTVSGGTWSIPSQITDSSGNYMISLAAPSSDGSYMIQAHFGGDSGFGPSDSPQRTINVSHQEPLPPPPPPAS